MSQVSPHTGRRSASVERGQKTPKSGEKQLADNTAESPAFEISHRRPYCKDGTSQFHSLAALKFQTENDECRRVKFTHVLVPQLPINGPLCRHDTKVDLREQLTEEECQRITTIRRRAKAADVPSKYSRSHSWSANPREDEREIWKLADEGLKALVGHFCEEYREWKWIPDREKKAGTHRSAAATRGTHQSTGAEAGKKLLLLSKTPYTAVYCLWYCTYTLS